MSLLQRVSAIEGLDRETALDEEDQEVDVPQHVIRRILSYDVVAPPATEAPAQIQHAAHEAAYKVPTNRRILQVCIAVLACWLASGIVFGFAALKPILLREGVYQDVCPEKHRTNIDEPCFEQDLRLNLFFTVASITTNVSALPVGTLVDRYGRRAGYVAGCIFLSAGSLLMGFAFAITKFDGYILANVFLALGGTLIFVPSYQMANAIPKYSGVIVALITGAFDASAAVFLLYKIAYDYSDGAFRPEHFFFAYVSVPILIILAEVTLMPAHNYHSVPELNRKLEKAQNALNDVHASDDEIASDGEITRLRSARAEQRKRRLSQIESLLGDDQERKERVVQEIERQQASGVWGMLHGLPVYRQMLTPWFILLLVLTTLQMLRMNYFIATLDTQYQNLLGPRRAERITNTFDIALPIGGVISTPFIGVLLDNMSEPAVLAILTLLITTSGGFNCIPATWAGYAAVILFVIMRPLYYSAMSDYATKVFGFATFGRIYGAIICVSGLVNFSQSALDALTLGPLEGNPIPVNAFLTGAAGVVTVTLTVSIWFKTRTVRQKEFERGTTEEQESLIPEEDEDEDSDW